MQDFEKLGAFYLGRPYDLAARRPRDGAVLYDSRDLVTHAVIIGMTGSGKTGLGIGLLEEAAIDGVPAIAIDPKGDLGNLLLTFPRLSPEDFRPWINEDDAARRGLSPEAFAADQAETWRRGLAEWGQDASRIARLRQAADLAIYTPGSSAGLGLSILQSIGAPPREMVDDAELLAERLSTSASGLLTLVGVDADPVRSREHILLSTLIGAAWKAGRRLDLGALIAEIQSPTVNRVGVMDIESFFPARERFELAMRLNGVLAAPSFAAWLEGEPLDIDRLLFGPTGRPRVAVVSIAHLADSERTFFVALLLNEILAWMRKQPGTSSLRAILYIDEVAGLAPPVANPPTKPPLLRLLKQGRAFGLGTVLATQNPVDLDYKGLSNTGTWFLGRLQTEQDRARVLDGLQSASAAGQSFDRRRADETLGALGKRIFLMQNVHEAGPEVLETRWTLSYLRGPLTREQIRTLMAPVKAAASAEGRVPAAAEGAGPPLTPPAPDQVAPRDSGPPRGTTSRRPVLPPDVPQFFLPAPRGARLVRYAPRLWASAQVDFKDTKLGLDERRAVSWLVPFVDGPSGVDWERSDPAPADTTTFETDPVPDAAFEELPAAAAKAAGYASWRRDLSRWLADTQVMELLRSEDPELVSKPGESERDLRIRLQLTMHERRDDAKERLRRKYAAKVAALQERLRRAQASVERQRDQATQQTMQSVWSMGATVIGAFLGRKVVSATNLGKAATAARSIGRARTESQDVTRAEENEQAVERQLTELESALEAELASLDAASEAAKVPLQQVAVKPKKTHIVVDHVALVWVPTE